MKTAAGILCACLLCIQAGCARNFGNTRIEADVRINDTTVDVALEDAVAKVKKELQKRGLEVTVTPSAAAVRVVSKTKTGDQFTLVFSRSFTASGKERTLVRVEWSTKPDRELWLGLVAVLGASVLQGAN